MKYLLLIITLFFLSTSVIASPRAGTFKTPIQKLTCLPANAATPGISTSLDFGRSNDGCIGFTCNSGFTPSGSTCITSVVANLTCPGGSNLLYCGHVSMYGSKLQDFYPVADKKYNCSAAAIATLFLCNDSFTHNAYNTESGCTGNFLQMGGIQSGFVNASAAPYNCVLIP